ncbi:MAG: DUF5060 domain-containing protein [bacterium]|jgi:hypothetical protein|nr:DUF5060 domain-containing protein [bacterium]
MKIRVAYPRFVFFLTLTSVIWVALARNGWSQETVSVPQYGLFETAFRVGLAYDNPYFSSSILVQAAIQTPEGVTQTVPCFYDRLERWKLRYTPSQPGIYAYAITAEAGGAREEVQSATFTVTASTHPGFVRVSKTNPRFFQFDNGDSYFPLGQNLSWVGSGPNQERVEVWRSYLDECQQAGINWIRLWMCSWGWTELVWNKNHDRYYGIETYSSENAVLIDAIFRLALERGIMVQLCINHHGQYSTTTNPIWDENPYNVANGGFLNHPSEFFTSPEAERHYKERLRYLVARWGAFPNLMAWEFFNEVDLTSFRDWADVTGWHERMAGILRELDPYDHLLTTSAAWQTDQTFPIRGMDFLQSHAYVPDVINFQQTKAARTQAEYPTVPHFFGEMSYNAAGPNREDRDGVILHNQLWASIHSWDSGAAMTWWWDNWVRPYNLYSHFAMAQKYIEGIDWVSETLVPLQAKVVAKPENTGEFSFSPKKGWGNGSVEEFVIQEDGTITDHDSLNDFIHGRYHIDMVPNPVFVVDAIRPVTFGLELEKVAQAGAVIALRVDGEEQFRRRFPSARADYEPGEDGIIQVAVAAGTHRIQVANVGNDWVTVKRFWLHDFIQRPEVFVRGHAGRILVWVHDRPHRFASLGSYSQYAPLVPSEIAIPGITEGEYHLEQFDPYSGEVTSLPDLAAQDDGLRIPMPSFTKDTAFRLRKTSAKISEFQVHGLQD